jgi:hypothetical protein
VSRANHAAIAEVPSAHLAGRGHVARPYASQADCDQAGTVSVRTSGRGQVLRFQVSEKLLPALLSGLG